MIIACQGGYIDDGNRGRYTDCLMQWGPFEAYCIGLITTDGNLSPSRRHISFTSKDLELVEYIRACFGTQYQKIGRKSRAAGEEKRYYCIQIGSVKLYHWLFGIGLTPRKSLTLGPLKVPNEFFADFLRGHLDGDGNICTYYDPVYPNSLRLYVRFNCASPSHLDWIQTRVHRLWSLKGYQGQVSGREFRLSYAKRESIRLLSYLYYSAAVPCLARKRRAADPFLNFAEVAELAYAPVSEAGAERHEGSTPSLRTLLNQ